MRQGLGLSRLLPTPVRAGTGAIIGEDAPRPQSSAHDPEAGPARGGAELTHNRVPAPSSPPGLWS